MSQGMLSKIRILIADDNPKSREGEDIYIRRILGIPADDKTAITPKDGVAEAVDAFRSLFADGLARPSAPWDIVLLDIKFDSDQSTASELLMGDDKAHGGLYAYNLMQEILAASRPLCRPIFLLYTGSTTTQEAYRPFLVTAQNDRSIGLRPFHVVVKSHPESKTDASDSAALQAALLIAEEERYRELCLRGLGNIGAVADWLDAYKSEETQALPTHILDLPVLPDLPLWKVFPVRCSIIANRTQSEEPLKVAAEFRDLLAKRNYAAVLTERLNRQPSSDVTGAISEFDGSVPFDEWFYITHPMNEFLRNRDSALWQQYFGAWGEWLKRSIAFDSAARIIQDLSLVGKELPVNGSQGWAVLQDWKKRSREPNHIALFVKAALAKCLDRRVKLRCRKDERLCGYQCYVDSRLLADQIVYYVTNNLQHMLPPDGGVVITVRPDVIGRDPRNGKWCIDLVDNGPGFRCSVESATAAIMLAGKPFQIIKERMAGWCEIQVWTQCSGEPRMVGISAATGERLDQSAKPSTKSGTVVRFIFDGACLIP
jgi:hypothetical protein